MSPFAEEVIGCEPADASLELKGAVAVVFRNSLLEEAHSSRPVEAGGIKGLSGAHRATAAKVVKQLEAEESAGGD